MRTKLSEKYQEEREEICKKLIIDGNQDSENNPTILNDNLLLIEEFIDNL